MSNEQSLTGIPQDLKEMIDFMAHVANLVGDIFADGKFTWSDVFRNIPGFASIPSLATTAWDGKENIKLENIKTPEERQEVLEYFKQAFDIPSETTEEDVEEGLSAVLTVFGFILKVSRNTATQRA